MATFADSIATLIADGATRDVVIITLVQEHGATLSKATSLYQAYAKEHGLSSASVSRKDDAHDMLADAYPAVEDWTVQAVRAAVVDLMADLDVAESTARDYCKAYSKHLGVPHPSEDPRAAMFAYLIEHGDLPYDELKAGFKAYATEVLGRSSSNVNEYWKGYDLHLALTAAKEA